MKNIITRLCLPALIVSSMLVLFHSTGSVLSAGSSLSSSAFQEEVASGAESKVPTWTVDTVHSCAMFRVRHMGAGFFWGRFNDVSGTIDLDPASWKSLSMDIVIDVASVDSGHPGLDKHLVSPDFFDSKEFPKITFKKLAEEMVDADAADLKAEIASLKAQKANLAEALEHPLLGGANLRRRAGLLRIRGAGVRVGAQHFDEQLMQHRADERAAVRAGVAMFDDEVEK